jgi:hypothetical protein
MFVFETWTYTFEVDPPQRRRFDSFATHRTVAPGNTAASFTPRKVVVGAFARLAGTNMR